jgi:hypothetical protein
VNAVDPLGLILKIDPSSPSAFQKNMINNLNYLINNSSTGLGLVNAAINSPNTITITPDSDGANTLGSILDPGNTGTTITLDPNSVTGASDAQYQGMQKSSEEPPNNTEGGAVTLAHELGHAVYNYGELRDVYKVENPVRKDLGLPPRKTFHCVPVGDKNDPVHGKTPL